MKFLAVLLGIALFAFLISRAITLDSAVNGDLQRALVEVGAR